MARGSHCRTGGAGPAARRVLPLVRAWVELDPAQPGRERNSGPIARRSRPRKTEADEQRTLAIRRLARPGSPPPRRSARGADAPAKPAPLKQDIRFCTASDGTTLAYSVTGAGPPLVKAANWLNHLEADFASPLWRHWIQALSTIRSLWRYDERGNGLSDWNAPLNFDAFVDDLESVVDAAGLDRFDLLGISQGAAVAIAYAVRHPERVRKMHLWGGYAMGWAIRGNREIEARREAMLELTRQGWAMDNPAFRQMFTSMFLPEATQEQANWFNEVQRTTTSAENAEALQRVFGTIDVRDLLAEGDDPDPGRPQHPRRGGSVRVRARARGEDSGRALHRGRKPQSPPARKRRRLAQICPYRRGIPRLRLQASIRLRILPSGSLNQAVFIPSPS